MHHVGLTVSGKASRSGADRRENCGRLFLGTPA